MSINKTDIVAAFGEYYIPEGQNMDRLKGMLRAKTSTVQSAKPIIYDGEVYRFSNVIFKEIIQQFQKKFTEKGDLEFKPNEIRLRNIKIDLSLYPDDVKGSWLGFLGSVTEMERANWPIVRYMVENEVVPQLYNDLETKAYFKGVYEAPQDGVAGSASKVMDGIKKLLDDGLAESDVTKKITRVNLPEASLTPTNIFDQVEAFADGLGDEYEGVSYTIHMSKKNLRAYLRDKRNTHGTDVNFKADKVTVDFSENVKLEGHTSMSGSHYLWGTPDDNFLYLRRVNGMSDPKVEESKREVFLMLDWWEGIGFGYNPLVHVWKPGFVASE